MKLALLIIALIMCAIWAVCITAQYFSIIKKQYKIASKCSKAIIFSKINIFIIFIILLIVQ